MGGDEGEGGPKGLRLVRPHPRPPPSEGEGIIGRNGLIRKILQEEDNP